MNSIKRLDVETCIEGLAWIILDVLAKEEVKRPREYVKLEVIRKASGIREKLEVLGGKNPFEHMIPKKILEYLLHKECVEESSILQAHWKITDAGLDEGQMNAIQEWDLETCIDGLADRILDVLRQTRKAGSYMHLSWIGTKSGIEDGIATPKNKNTFRDAFTHALLEYLRRKGRVEEGPGRGQWKIADLEYQERQA